MLTKNYYVMLFCKGKYMKLSRIKKLTFYTLLIISSFSTLMPSDIEDVGNQILGGLRGVYDGVKGMLGAFGYLPDDYTVNIRIWNDSPGLLGVAKQEMTKILEAGFAGNVTRIAEHTQKGKKVPGLLPYTNTGDWMKEKLYFTLWLLIDRGNLNYDEYKTKVEDYALVGTAFPGFGTALGALFGGMKTTDELDKYKLYSKDMSQKDPDNVYHFRAYTKQGKIYGEYLGIKTVTQEFSGVFFNSTDNNKISLEFLKDGTTYKVGLEAHTFSLLNSSTGNPTSIRGPKKENRAFTFYNDSSVVAAIPIPAQGVCNVQLDPKTNKLIPGSPMVYTYEVFPGKLVNKKGPKVGVQGLAIGNFNQPFDPANPQKNIVRDINPLQCHVWYQSDQQAQTIAAQEIEAQAKAGEAPGTPPTFYNFTEQVWVFYKTKDSTYQKKLSPGDVIDFNVIRPRLSEKNAWIYVVALKTNDDKKALTFLNRLADGVIGEDLKEPVTKIKKFDVEMALTTIQTNTHGLINDTAGSGSSGIQGFVLLTDKILPRGIGIGPFYYQINPPQVDVSQLIDLFSSYLHEKNFTNINGQMVLSDAVQKELTNNIKSWIALYQKKKNQVVQQVTQYLQEKGADALFSDPKAATKTLNDLGKKAVTALISDPVSIANYPQWVQGGTNQYVYYLGDTPKDWPTK